jgi:integrase/recombinase XerD
MNQLAIITASNAPALVVAAGSRASYRFLEFFTAQIRNPHTRRAGTVMSGRRPLIKG